MYSIYVVVYEVYIYSRQIYIHGYMIIHDVSYNGNRWGLNFLRRIIIRINIDITSTYSEICIVI